MAENAERKQRGRPFQKGQSGNPKGKPPGLRHKATRAVEALLEGEAEELTRKAVELAKDGDVTALRLCLERLVPPRRDRPVSFDLPPIDSAGEAAQAFGAILSAVADGSITPAEGQAVADLLAAYAKTLETSELEKRITALEKGAGQ